MSNMVKVVMGQFSDGNHSGDSIYLNDKLIFKGDERTSDGYKAVVAYMRYKKESFKLEVWQKEPYKSPDIVLRSKTSFIDGEEV